jgi:hypothetical protein
MKRKLKNLGLFLLLAGLVPTEALAKVTVFEHSTDALASAAAVALAIPATETGRVAIRRIRITSSATSTITFTFTEKRTSDALFQTEDVSGCAAPGCSTQLVVEGVGEGRVADLDGMDLVLPRGARMYMHADTDVGTEFTTVEVYYDQI